MLAKHLPIEAIGVIAGSYAEIFCVRNGLAHTVIEGRGAFLGWLAQLRSSILITNGCPYRVPVGDYPALRGINIHPSYLPELRGADPVPGAILFARASGATCHVMDASFDTGPIIAQVALPYDPLWDARTLYPQCFALEAQIFADAFARDFVPAYAQTLSGNEMYYSFKPGDLSIDPQEDAASIIRRVRAFNTPNKLARLTHEGQELKIVQAMIVDADYRPRSGEILLHRGEEAVILQVHHQPQ